MNRKIFDKTGKSKQFTNHSSEILAGINPIYTFMDKYPNKVIKIFIIKSSNNPRIIKICELARQHGIAIQEVKKSDKLDSWFDEPTNHQGIIAEIKPTVFLTEKDLYVMVKAQVGHKVVLLALNQVQDPRNLGACIRNAAAFGVDAVILPKSRSCDLTTTVRKVASGGVDLVPIVKVSNLYNCLEKLKEHGVWVVSLAAANTTALASLDLQMPLVLVLGSEDLGVQDLITRKSDFLAKIPLVNTAIDSLNLSVAAGICLYEVHQQRQYNNS